jgi:hypothetical protein
MKDGSAVASGRDENAIAIPAADAVTPIKHIVMWNLAGDTPAEKAAAVEAVKTRFEGLLGVVPGLLHIEIGVDVSHVSYACDVVLYSIFESHEALAAYGDHPAHLKVRDELVGVRIARHQVDYATPAGTRMPVGHQAAAARQPQAKVQEDGRE